jgi:hypothetical protein
LAGAAASGGGRLQRGQVDDQVRGGLHGQLGLLDERLDGGAVRHGASGGRVSCGPEARFAGRATDGFVLGDFAAARRVRTGLAAARSSDITTAPCSESSRSTARASVGPMPAASNDVRSCSRDRRPSAAGTLDQRLDDVGGTGGGGH